MAVNVGDILEGKVKTITDFGAFVDLEDGTTGLVHISEVADGYVKSVAEHLKVEQVVKVKVIAVDNKKVSLSIKKALPPKKSYNKPKETKEDNLSFEDRLSKFLKDSEERQSGVRRAFESKRSRR